MTVILAPLPTSVHWVWIACFFIKRPGVCLQWEVGEQPQVPCHRRSPINWPLGIKPEVLTGSGVLLWNQRSCVGSRWHSLGGGEAMAMCHLLQDRGTWNMPIH